MIRISTLPSPRDEEARLRALHRLAILDTAPEERFERIARLARRCLEAPIALISLVDRDRQWFKANEGLGALRETPRDVSFCSHAIKTPGLLLVPDARMDARFCGNPFVTGEPHIRFYAGQPLRSVDGHRVGTLCVIDRRPRHLTAEDLATLADLAAMAEAELHASNQENALTQLRALSESLREEKEKFEAFLHHSPCVVFMKDAQSRLLYINRRGEEIFERRLEELHGLADDEWLPEAAARRTMENDRRILESGETMEFEETVASPDGRVRHLLSLKFPIAHTSGALMLGGVSVEVTAQRAAEERLRSVSALQSAVLDHVHASIIATDADGLILTFNPTAERWLGYTAEEVVGRMNAARLHVPEEMYDSARELSAELGRPVSPGAEYVRTEVERAGSFEREWTYVRKDGSRFPVLVSVTGLHDAEGRFQGFVGIARDITQSKQAEGALREAKEAAEAANAAKSAFVATMSHEVRTPLNGIIGLNAMLLDTELSPAQRKVAELLQTNAESLMGIVNDVLDYAKVQARRLTLEKIDFDLPELAGSLVECHRVLGAAKGLTVEARLGESVPRRWRGDPGRLRQVLDNLLGNAVKFSSRGTILLAIEDGGPVFGAMNRLRFSVTDEGMGIPREQQRRIFEPFSQGDSSTTREFGGTGLGLAICRELVALMDGELEVESTAGEGATFRFTASFEPAADEPAAPAAPAPGRSCSGLRVLVAEDSAVNRRVVTYQLEKHGCLVATAANGREAVAAVLRNRYDLVLMDCQMPIMDGYAAAAEIRRREGGSRRTRMIALTANVSDEARAKCAASGMDGYLSKPFLPADLRRLLENTPAIERCEIESLREDCGGPAEFEELVELFRAEMETNLPLLHQAWESANPELLASTAHRIRGAAANFGARRLQEQCRLFEKQARAGELKGIGARLPEVEREAGEVMAALTLECRSA